MTKEELRQKAEVCMHNALFWLKLPISKENVEQGGSYILKLLEPREKRIVELEKEKCEMLGLIQGKDKVIAELEAQIERMKNNCLDLIRVQGFNLTDDYMAGMYNGMAVVYNSCFLDGYEKKGEGYCHKNNFNKWEIKEKCLKNEKEYL